MRIQPVQGSGSNVGFDAATGSITISNEGLTPFLYLRVNNKIPFGDEVEVTGYYRYYDFYEVTWNGTDFEEVIGGLFADFDTRETCPKLYAMPYDIDEPTNQGNFAGNIGVSGQGLVYVSRYRGTDSTDGRDVYEFLRSLDPSSKCFVEIDETGIINGYYPALGFDTLSQSSANMGLFWCKDINGGELVSGRKYVGYYVGSSYNPYPNDPTNSDPRPIVTLLNSLVSGPTGITVVTDVTCVNGFLANTYATIYPSETVQIAEDTKKSFISLNDTPSSYAGVANYYVAVNPTATGLSFTSTNPASVIVPSLSFINLKDCPSSYSGTSGRIVTSTGSGLAFTFVAFTTPTDSSVIPKQGVLNSTIQFKLINDELTPGANKYYGTNGSGVKGWYDLP
tara:strand:+ start:2851 stop:4032 length:1182 start_codon:yes stop_codon:yes gene_type:complete